MMSNNSMPSISGIITSLMIMSGISFKAHIQAGPSVFRFQYPIFVPQDTSRKLAQFLIVLNEQYRHAFILSIILRAFFLSASSFA